MMKKSLFVDIGILKTNRHFRNVFIARTISLLGLGMLSVAIPLQVFELTGDSLKVGLAMGLEGAGLFVGLLLGGVLADRTSRKGLILFARSVCGLGFVGLAVNAWLAEPQLWVIYALSVWDGFFGALGVSALLAAMPMIVGRENLMQARAVSMVSIRLATVLSPALGGAIIAASSVAWNYTLAALATGLTLLPLLSLPALKPDTVEAHHPLRVLADGFRFVLGNRVVLSVVVLGTVVTFTTAIRVLFPALVERYGGAAFELGLMYSAVSLGATLGAIVSGWAQHLKSPGAVMLGTSLGVFVCLILLGINAQLLIALGLLVVFGYLVSICSLLEYTLVQGHTPDHYLGRVNAIWTAQEASGDSLAAVAVGALGKSFSALSSVLALGGTTLAAGLLMALGCKALRRAPMEAGGGLDSVST